jgi:hypothetical protein
VTKTGEGSNALRTGDTGFFKMVLHVGGKLPKKAWRKLFRRYAGPGYVFSGNGRELTVYPVSYLYHCRHAPGYWEGFPERLFKANGMDDLFEASRGGPPAF